MSTGNRRTDYNVEGSTATYLAHMIIAIVLVVLLFFIAWPTSASAKQFSDVTTSNQNEIDAINFVSDKGYMNGTSSTQFSPATNVTRAQVVQVLFRMSGVSESSVVIGNTFNDVHSSDWFAKAVYWCLNNGIASGTSSNTFSPNQLVTREQALTILLRYANYATGGYYNIADDGGYSLFYSASDYTSVHNYAKLAVGWALNRQIITLTSQTSGYIYPLSNINRTSFAVIIKTYSTNYEKLKNHKDYFKFKNIDTNFSSNYHLQYSHLVRLQSYINSYYVTQNAKDIAMQAISDWTNRPWAGSCFGMSSVVTQDRYGKIGFANNYQSSAPDLYSINKSTSDSIESAINYYQIIQFFPKYPAGNSSNIMTGTGTHPELINVNLGNNWSSAISAIQGSKGLFILSVAFQNNSGNLSSHAMVGLNWKLVSSAEWQQEYQLKVYDPDTASLRTIYLLKSLSDTYLIAFDINNPRRMYDIAVQNNMSLLGNFDIDGKWNTNAFFSYNNSQSYTTDNNNDENDRVSFEAPYDSISRIEISLSQPFIIENDDGDTIIWDGTSFSGSEIIFNYQYVSYGIDSPASIIIDVPTSKVFNVTFQRGNDGTDTWFAVTDSYRYEVTVKSEDGLKRAASYAKMGWDSLRMPSSRRESKGVSVSMPGSPCHCRGVA